MTLSLSTLAMIITACIIFSLSFLANFVLLIFSIFLLVAFSFLVKKFESVEQELFELKDTDVTYKNIEDINNLLADLGNFLTEFMALDQYSNEPMVVQLVTNLEYVLSKLNEYQILSEEEPLLIEKRKKVLLH